MKKERIEDALIKIGIYPNITGFQLIVMAIQKLEIQKCNPIKWVELYRDIAKECGSSYSRTERNLRHALASSRTSGVDHNVIDYYIGPNGTSLSSSLSIFNLRLKREEYDDKDSD